MTPSEHVKWAGAAKMLTSQSREMQRRLGSIQMLKVTFNNSQQLSTISGFRRKNPTVTGLHKASPGFTAMRFLSTKLQSSPPSGRGSSCAYGHIPGQKCPQISDVFMLKPLKPTIQIPPYSSLLSVPCAFLSPAPKNVNHFGKKNCSSLSQNAQGRQSPF